MAGHKTKIVAFLAAAALSSGLIVARSAGWGAAAVPSEKVGYEAGSLFGNDPNLWSQRNDLGTRDLVSKTVIAVLIVAALGAAAIYISKKLLPKLANLPGREIRIVETAHLGPKKAVHLVRIGNQRFLVGSTNENIIMLANVTEALSESELSEEESRDFQRINGR